MAHRCPVCGKAYNTNYASFCPCGKEKSHYEEKTRNSDFSRTPLTLWNDDSYCNGCGREKENCVCFEWR